MSRTDWVHALPYPGLAPPEPGARMVEWHLHKVFAKPRRRLAPGAAPGPVGPAQG